MSPTTLRIRVESTEQFHDEVLDDLEALEAGEVTEDKYVVSLPDEQALSRVFNERNLQLIRTVADEEPASMRETARLVGRDIKEVSRNLNELAQLGVVRLEDEGRSKRPVVWYDEIDLTVSVHSDSTDSREIVA